MSSRISIRYIGSAVFFLTACLLVFSGYGSSPVSAEPVTAPSQNKIFMPLVYKPGSSQILLGVYTDNYLGFQSTIDNEVKAVDTWAGKKLSIVATFIAIEDLYPDEKIQKPLGIIWDSGYTPFVNLETGKRLADINSGSMDGDIIKRADAFKQWRAEGTAKGQYRKALLAPLQEMNGDWVSYHGSPADFKAAFTRIRNIFNQRGAGPAVRWVFAPNGWSDPRGPQFEDYYPGDSLVEALAFSGFNSGYCGTAAYKVWDSPQTAYGPYIQRMLKMAPQKPIFVAQTATTAHTQYGYSEQAKNEWLRDAYIYLASLENVRGVIYFNKYTNQTCDWPFFIQDGAKFDGYRQGVNRPEYLYVSPADLAAQSLFVP